MVSVIRDHESAPKTNQSINRSIDQSINLLKCLAHTWHPVKNVAEHSIFCFCSHSLHSPVKLCSLPSHLFTRNRQWVHRPWSQTKGGFNPGTLCLLCRAPGSDIAVLRVPSLALLKEWAQEHREGCPRHSGHVLRTQSVLYLLPLLPSH